MRVEFLAKCKCGFFRKSQDSLSGFKDLTPYSGCKHCYGPARYKCPKCASLIKVKRVNNEHKA
jgi:hypothetical protein